MLTDILEHIIASFIGGILALGAFLTGGIVIPSEPLSERSAGMVVEVPEEPFRKLVTPPSSEEEVAEPTPITLPELIPPSSPLPLPPSPKVAFTIINTQTRAATVNILCTVKNGNTTEVVTGSGVIVDPRGVVLTNAHVAQFFLLIGNHPPGVTTCSVRTENPSTDPFEAKLLYLPPAWINKHAKDIDNLKPLGTGENDYAFLLLTDPKNPKVYPETLLPFISINTAQENIDVGDGVLIAGYPARTVIKEKENIEQLTLSSTIAIIEKLFTFEEQTLDLLSLGDTTLSYKGSSGGAVVDEYNMLIGIINSSTDGPTAKERKLRAITLAHIDRSLKKYTGFDLNFWLLGNLALKAKLYNSGVAPALTSQLVQELRN